MPSEPIHRGDLSQDSSALSTHRSGVTPRLRSVDPASKRTRGAYNSLSASSVGLELGISVLVAMLGGMWLDDQLGTTPWLMIVCLGIGFAAGFRGVLRAVKRADRAAEAEAQHG
jgi:ATP synthase protein I